MTHLADGFLFGIGEGFGLLFVAGLAVKIGYTLFARSLLGIGRRD